MIETIEIKDFLRTGNFGEFKEIHFGMKRERLVEIVGETEWKHYSRKKSKFPSIYKYGKVEFYFEEGENGRLYGIQIQPIIRETELVNFKINYDFIASNLDYESILKFLDLFSIKYKELDFEYDSEGIQRIETEGGVQLIFSKDYFNTSNSLHKISKFITLNSNQLKEKQISFSLPESAYEKLKRRANKEKKSISNICKAIIIGKMNQK